MKKIALQTLGWIISIVLILWLIQKLDLASSAQRLASADWSLLFAAAMLNLLVIPMKALRWQLMTPRASRTSFREIVRITFVAHAGNNLLPARGGDLLRIHLLNRSANIRKLPLAAISGAEKLFDMAIVVLFFGVLLLLATPPEWMSKGVFFASLLLLGGCGAFGALIVYSRKKTSSATGAFQRHMIELAHELRELHRHHVLGLCLLISAAYAFLLLAVLVLCQQALGVHLPLWAPLLVYLATTFAATVPSAPSHVGTFEFAGTLAYAAVGLAKSAGLSITIAYHLIQILPVTAVGLWCYWAGNFRRKHARPVAQIRARTDGESHSAAV